MAPPGKRTTKPGKVGNPDFKRIKAKVGKRAPKALNDTDVSFKAVSLNVQKQTVASERNKLVDGELLTARGRSIQDLTLQLQHHAHTARFSAAKGLKDLISGKCTNPEIVQHFLSVLVPAIAKCCIDEDNDVRELGLAVLREMIQKLNLVEGSDASISLRPFLPLLMAFISSALSSLHKSTRLDGAAALQVLSISVPVLVAPYVTEVLPAFVRLLSDRNQGIKTAPESNSSAAPAGGKKRKRAQAKSAKGAQHLLLQSLTSLLQAGYDQSQSSYEGASQPTETLTESDLVFTRGGRSRNALFVQGRPSVRRTLPSVASLADFSPLDNVSTVRGDTCDTFLEPEPATDVLGRLRDSFVETSQKAPGQDQSTYLVLAKALRIFWQSYGRDTYERYGNEKFRKVCLQMQSLILDVFPLRGVMLAEEALEEANSELCLTLVGMSSKLGLESRKEEWTETVMHYVQSTLEKSKASNDEVAFSTARTSMEVFGQLLFLRSGDEPILGSKARTAMVDTFCSVFFPGGGVEASVVCSAGGRQAVTLARKVFEQSNYDIHRAGEEFGAAALAIAMGLPHYVTAWGSEYPSDSSSAILLLHNIVRRIDDPSHPLLAHLRTQLEPIVESRPVKGSGKLSATTLEQFSSPMLQRLTVGLFVMLGAPTTKTLAGLGEMCARCHSNLGTMSISRDVAALIMGSVHSFRRSMSVQSYLSFVIDCTGLMKIRETALVDKSVESEDPNEMKVSWKRLLEFDNGLCEACCCFTDCGSLKVLPMMFPLLSTWLDCSKTDDMKNRDVLQLRGALCFLAMFSVDIKTASTCDSIFPLLSEGSEQVILRAICRFAELAPTTEDADPTGVLGSVRPLLSLLESERPLFAKTFHSLVSTLATMNGTAQSRVLHFLLTCVKSPQLATVVKEESKELLPAAKAMETSLAEGPLEGLAGRVLAELELLATSTSVP